jgi:hypothetical protein
MEQDISVKMMMLEVKVEDSLPEECYDLMRKYLSLMWVVGFDAGRKDVFANYAKNKTAVIQRDKEGNRIGQWESVKQASTATRLSLPTIFSALKTHKKTRIDGFYFDKVRDRIEVNRI